MFPLKDQITQLVKVKETFCEYKNEVLQGNAKVALHIKQKQFRKFVLTICISWQLTMVIQETLRLYPPAPYVSRNALKDIQLKNILVPKGINIQIPISILHLDTNLWGSDAHQFNPGRFENGILGACKLPQAYIPFGVGTRICVGQHLAMTELKVMLSLILSKFCFSISPAYRHSPAFRLVIQPEHGVNLQVESI